MLKMWLQGLYFSSILFQQYFSMLLHLKWTEYHSQNSDFLTCCIMIKLWTFCFQTNQTNLNVTFSLDKWPRSCCQFDVEVYTIIRILSALSDGSLYTFFIIYESLLQVKPLFPHCGQDCVRSRRTLDICPGMYSEWYWKVENKLTLHSGHMSKGHWGPHRPKCIIIYGETNLKKNK